MSELIVGKRRGGRPRSSGEIARDRRRIGDLYLKGWLQADIATEIGMSRATVSRDLKSLHKGWLKASLIDFNQAKANELGKLDHLEREHWNAWILSWEHPPEGGGDPRFLAGVQKCIERRCKILGFDAPQGVDVTSGGRPVKAYAVFAVSPDVWPGREQEGDDADHTG